MGLGKQVKEKLQHLIDRNTAHHRSLFDIAVTEFNTADWEGLQKTASRLKGSEGLNKTLTSLLSEVPKPDPDHCPEPTLI